MYAPLMHLCSLSPSHQQRFTVEIGRGRDTPLLFVYLRIIMYPLQIIELVLLLLE
jgi:hypothetical protein